MMLLNPYRYGVATGIQVQAGAYVTTTVTPTDATCSVAFSAAGGVTAVADSGPTYNWKTPTGGGDGGLYSILFETQSGTLDSGTADAWLDLSSNRSFGVSRVLNAAGSKTWTGRVKIKRNSDGTILADEAVSLTATVTE